MYVSVVDLPIHELGRCLWALLICISHVIARLIYPVGARVAMIICKSFSVVDVAGLENWGRTSLSVLGVQSET